MDLNLESRINNEFCIWSNIRNLTLENDISEEYTLPDYLPDIKRILMVRAKIRDDGCYVDNGRLEIDGEAAFNVIYLTSENRISCFTHTAPYNNGTAADYLYEDSKIECNPKLKNPTCRPLNPRKVSLKARVSTEISIRNRICVSPKVTGNTTIEDEFTLERNTDNMERIDLYKSEVGDIRVSEDLELDASMPPIREIISCDVDVFANECKIADGKINLKGNARVTCLCSTQEEGEEDEKYIVIEKNIPLSHLADADAGTSDMDCMTTLDIGAVETGIANNKNGESKIIELDFVCKAKLLGMKNDEAVFTRDVYSTDYSYNTNYKEIETERLLQCLNTNFSVDGNMALGDTKATKVLYSDASVEMTGTKIENGRLTIEGECNVKALLETEDEEKYISKDFTFPVKYEMPSTCNDNCEIMLEGSVIALKTRLDSQGIAANAEIGLNITLLEKLKENIVDNIFIDKSSPSEEEKSGTFTLCYPDNDETLWSISRRYGVSRSDICEANGIKETDSPSRVLIIPRKKARAVYNKVI